MPIGSLAVGVQGGLLTEDLDGSKLDLADKGDPAFSTSSVTGNALDLGAGLYYLHRNWYVGASVQHLTAPKVELGETNEMNIDRTYYLTGGYNIRLRIPCSVGMMAWAIVLMRRCGWIMSTTRK